jgi:methylenetetrahydrofolate--tRNA-(uracil-5-)-methyltransferase
VPPPTTALGALLRYITDPERKKFQPMNVHFGLMPSLPKKLDKKAKKEELARRALADMDAWIGEILRTDRIPCEPIPETAFAHSEAEGGER